MESLSVPGGYERRDRRGGGAITLRGGAEGPGGGGLDPSRGFSDDFKFARKGAVGGWKDYLRNDDEAFFRDVMEWHSIEI